MLSYDVVRNTESLDAYHAYLRAGLEAGDRWSRVGQIATPCSLPLALPLMATGHIALGATALALGFAVSGIFLAVGAMKTARFRAEHPLRLPTPLTPLELAARADRKVGR